MAADQRGDGCARGVGGDRLRDRSGARQQHTRWWTARSTASIQERRATTRGHPHNCFQSMQRATPAPTITQNSRTKRPHSIPFLIATRCRCTQRRTHARDLTCSKTVRMLSNWRCKRLWPRNGGAHAQIQTTTVLPSTHACHQQSTWEQ